MLTGILERYYNHHCDELASSKLFDETTFYKAFVKDLRNCRSEVIIDCPFLTCRRVKTLLPVFAKLWETGVSMVVNTRDPLEHDDVRAYSDALKSVGWMQQVGVRVLYTGGEHRKLAILDRRILYEGSLNILSQSKSHEIMRRIDSTKLASEMVQFVELEKFVR